MIIDHTTKFHCQFIHESFLTLVNAHAHRHRKDTKPTDIVSNIFGMGSEVTSIYPATGSTEYFNSSKTTINPTGKETLRWTDAEIARMIQIIVRPILVVLGTVGNG